MLNKTDSDKVREVAISLLLTDVKDVGVGPFASHPFTDFWHACVESDFVDLHESDSLLRWRNFEEKIIKSVSPLTLFRLVCKPYRLTFLKYAAPYMSAHDIGTTLRETWRSVENISSDVNVSQKEMVDLYRIADKSTLMTDEEIYTYRQLPPTVTVYRGVTDFNKEKRRAMSWTTSMKTAEWFAKRYNNTGEIWSMNVDKKNILAYFDTGEHEVVILPKAIKNMKKRKLEVCIKRRKEE